MFRPALLLLLLWLAVSHSALAAPSLDASYGLIPLAFTLNTGQAPDHIRFTARGSGCGMAFSPSGTTFLLSRETPASVARRSAKRSVVFEDTPETKQPDYETFALGLEFVGANENPEIIGEDRLPWNNNYFIGNDPNQWRTDVPNYKKIRFKEVYKGIDLVYYGNRKRVKYDFVVRPGENPEQILLKYDFEGYEGSLSVNGKGELVVKTPVGEIIEEKPYCYQKIGGKEVEVEVGYEVVGGGQYRFRVGEYDEKYDLVIDPELVYSTYLGGVERDTILDIAVDNEGNAYVTGECAHGFPFTPAAYDTTHSPIFVSKLNPRGTALIYSTFLTGIASHESPSVEVDENGNACVAGETISSDFPLTDNAIDKKYSAGEVFITKLNREGNELVFSTFFGGDSIDEVLDIAMDTAGDIYLVGRTGSSDFPTTPGAYQTQNSTKRAAFVSKICNNGSRLVFSTLFQEGYCERALGIAVDQQGNPCIMGQTQDLNFPITQGAYTQPLKGQLEAYVTKFKNDGSGLIFSTLIGGSNNDIPTGIAVDSEGAAYICGFTGEAQNTFDFPTTPGAFQTNRSRVDNVGFVAKFSQSGVLSYSTLIQGADLETGRVWLNDIVVNQKNQALVVGTSGSSSFPTTPDAFFPEKPGIGQHIILSIISEDGGSLVYSTYWGSGGGTSITLNAGGNVLVSGSTSSKEFPVTPGVVDENVTWEYEGVPATDGVISKFHIYFTSSTIESVTGELPSFRITGVYPNPFNLSTTVEFNLPYPGQVGISVYSMTGQKVFEKWTNIYASGIQQIYWNGMDEYGEKVSSGTYIIRIVAGKHSAFTKAMFLK
ncbi:MAG: DUF7948 domain-containing protein [Candidatus Latescibacterota bacterium]